MKKKNVFITGATGGMGYETLKQILGDTDKLNVTILVRDSQKNHKLLEPYGNTEGLRILWGDLLDFDCVYEGVKEADLVLHIAAFVSPAADYYPEKAMKNNYGSTKNIIEAVKKAGRQDICKFVNIGTVAETGDRMPPIHWGRVGDPIKPSMFDYYAVSKVAAERYVIEAGLKYRVSLRQTGIIGPAMSKIRDAIMFHNCFDNVLEYVSDRDSGRLMRNLCVFDAEGMLPEEFWAIFIISETEKAVVLIRIICTKNCTGPLESRNWNIFWILKCRPQEIFTGTIIWILISWKNIFISDRMAWNTITIPI